MSARAEEIPEMTSPPSLLYDPCARPGRQNRPPQFSETYIDKCSTIPEEIINKSSDIYQRTSWRILQRSIYNLLKKVNSTCDIRKICEKLQQINVYRGRGMFCRLIMDDNLYSNQNEHFAELVSVINDHCKEIGELLLVRLILKLKSAFKQNDLFQCLSSVEFIAHLINHSVANTNLAFDLLQLFLKPPTEDSIEMICMLWNVCGRKLRKTNKKKVKKIKKIIKKMLRDKQLSYQVHNKLKDVLQMMRNKRYSYVNFNPVLYDYKYTHIVGLNDVIDPQNILDYYHFDPEYAANEYKNKLYCQINLKIRNEEYSLLCDTADDEMDGSRKEYINELNFRELELIINQIVCNSCDYETCGLQLINLQICSGLEMNVCNMMFDFVERRYNESLGYTAQILCQLNSPRLVNSLELLFINEYRLNMDTRNYTFNGLRNVARFFAQLLISDVISWWVLSKIDLTSWPRRTFVKILFNELLEHMGLHLLSVRIQDLFQKRAFEGILLENYDSSFLEHFLTFIGCEMLLKKLNCFRFWSQGIKVLVLTWILVPTISSRTSSEKFIKLFQLNCIT